MISLSLTQKMVKFTLNGNSPLKFCQHNFKKIGMKFATTPIFHASESFCFFLNSGLGHEHIKRYGQTDTHIPFNREVVLHQKLCLYSLLGV